MKFLIVDDSNIARILIIKLIREYNPDLTILEAQNGREAVDIFTRERPDVTILDLTMPVMNGFEALEKMKALDGESTILILTADIQEKAIERCLAMGAAGVIKKVPKKERLYPLLDKILKGKDHGKG